MEEKFLTLEEFMSVEGIIEKKITEVKPGDILTVLPEYGAGKVKVKDLHYDREGKPAGIITDRGIFHPASFKGITE